MNDSLEGWTPELADEAALAHALDRAFDYRGDVSIGLASGESITGYVSNRDHTAEPPYFEIWLADENTPRRVRRADVESITFSGRDTADGRSWEAWVAKWKAGRGEEWPPVEM